MTSSSSMWIELNPIEFFDENLPNFDYNLLVTQVRKCPKMEMSPKILVALSNNDNVLKIRKSSKSPHGGANKLEIGRMIQEHNSDNLLSIHLQMVIYEIINDIGRNLIKNSKKIEALTTAPKKVKWAEIPWKL